MTRRLPLAVGLALLLPIAASDADAAVPAWVQQITSAPGPQAARAAATVLLDQVDVTVDAEGKERTVRRYAVRIDDRTARSAARLREVYLADSGRVRAIRGWLSRRGGELRELGGSSVIDAALVNNDVYNEVRVRAISAVDDIAEGDVFAAEVESDDRLLFAQFDWQLQERWPVVLARRTLTLPAGWRARAVTFNAPPIASRTEGLTTIWEASDLREIPDERSMLPVSSLAPRVVASITGAAGREPPGQFDDWRDAAVWLDALSQPDAVAAPSVSAKARELTAAAASELDRITAIAAFVQHLQYVSIQTGVGRGGGYQPRPPALVLERNYGDCKDKASLMRALLGAAGIRAYLVAIFSGDRDYVRAEWPSPQQFNHAIVAIAVQPDTARGAESIVEHAALGRLLIFDPTDPYTPVGELPLTEQGSLALVVSPESDRLERMPMAPRGHDRLLRSVEGTVDAEGTLSAHVTERSRGARAADQRAALTLLDGSTYRAMIQRQLAAAMPGAQLTGVDPGADAESGEFALGVDVTAARFAQSMGNLLLLKLPFSGRDPVAGVSAATRLTPLALSSLFVDETVQLQFDPTLTIDELPQPVAIESVFGRYSLGYTTTADRVLAHRVFEVPAQTIAVTQYADLVRFFEHVRAADSAPMVLTR